jgi:hypothetical protein
MADQTTINDTKIRNEVVNYLRNKDLIPVGTRGVTTGSDTGTFTSASTYTLSHTNAKNIRSIVVGATTLKYGRDYTFTSAGVITFTAAQSGAYTISYDYGNSDRIFPDWPRDMTSISQFPRIAVLWTDATTQPGGFGSVDVSDIDMSVVVFGTTTIEVETIINSIRSNVRTDKSNFWYLGAWTQIISTGPYVMETFGVGHDKLIHQNIDIRGRIRYEK